MNDAYKNTLVLLILLLLVGGVGGYYVYFWMPERISELKKREKVLRLQKAKLSELFEEQASSRKRADQMMARWRSRYKTIPGTLRTAEVVQYLNERTRSGYENIGITFEGTERRSNFKTLTFRVHGQGFFAHLYRLLWQIEQRRELFRVSNLNVEHRNVTRPAGSDGGQERFIMTEFSFDLEAYFGGMRGVSAPEHVASIPTEVLPPESPEVNPFYPVIMRDLPPNQHDRVNVEEDRLVSIVGEEARFQRNGAVRKVSEGDRVYLGRITEVDPKQGRVVVRLNKGGIYDRIVLSLSEGGLQRQARGDTRLSAIEDDSED